MTDTTGNHAPRDCAAEPVSGDSKSRTSTSGISNSDHPSSARPPELQSLQGETGRVHRHGGFLDGQLLVAMPGMSDERFARSVIYLCAHSEEGAMGIVINRAAPKVKFPELLVQLDVIGRDEAIRLPDKAGAMQVLKGGPVETGRGFVLHSSDFFIDNSTLAIDDAVSLTATIDILRAIARGEGPDHAVLALGYAGWQAGQLEAEMQGNGWLNVPTDPTLIFDGALDSKYERAVKGLGIDLSRLSTECGRA